MRVYLDFILLSRKWINNIFIVSRVCVCMCQWNCHFNSSLAVINTHTHWMCTEMEKINFFISSIQYFFCCLWVSVFDFMIHPYFIWTVIKKPLCHNFSHWFSVFISQIIAVIFDTFTFDFWCLIFTLSLTRYPGFFSFFSFDF